MATGKTKPQDIFHRPYLKQLVVLLLLGPFLLVFGCGSPEPGGPGQPGSVAGDPEDGILAAPRIEIATTAHDFGTIDQTDSPSCDFTFTNRGHSLLFIHDLRASCGCTMTKIEKKTIAPGDRGVLNVTFNPKGRAGKQEKTITLFTNDPESPTVVLTILANVITEFGIEQRVANLGRVHWNEPSSVIVDLLAESPGAVQINRIDSSSPLLSSRLITAKTPAGDSYPSQIELNLKPVGKVDKFRASLTIMTSSTTTPKVDLQVVAMIVGDIQLDPAAVTFEDYYLAPEKVTSVDVLIKTNADRPFQITGVVEETGYLDLQTEEIVPGREFLLRVIPRLAADKDIPQQFRSLVQIHTDNELQPVLELPVIVSAGDGSALLTKPPGSPRPAGKQPFSQNPIS